MSAIKKSLTAARRLSKAVDALHFADPVTHVYNPLSYAWAAHEQYLRMMNPDGCRVLLLGMNPGPWGMAQTGVPFGQIAAVPRLARHRRKNKAAQNLAPQTTDRGPRLPAQRSFRRPTLGPLPQTLPNARRFF